MAQRTELASGPRPPYRGSISLADSLAAAEALGRYLGATKLTEFRPNTAQISTQESTEAWCSAAARGFMAVRGDSVALSVGGMLDIVNRKPPWGVLVLHDLGVVSHDSAVIHGGVAWSVPDPRATRGFRAHAEISRFLLVRSADRQVWRVARAFDTVIGGD